jgi:hypothetical protein
LRFFSTRATEREKKQGSVPKIHVPSSERDTAQRKERDWGDPDGLPNTSEHLVGSHVRRERIAVGADKAGDGWVRHGSISDDSKGEVVIISGNGEAIESPHETGDGRGVWEEKCCEGVGDKRLDLEKCRCLWS